MTLPTDPTLLIGAGSAPYYNVQKSLRFRQSASAQLSRTFGTPTSALIWTISFWMKRGKLNSSGYQDLMSSSTDASAYYIDHLIENDYLEFQYGKAGTSATNLTTAPVLRDVSGWYHVLYAINLTLAAATDRVKIYLNGVQLTVTGTRPTQNDTTYKFNQNGIVHYIAGEGSAGSSTTNFDGYFAEYNFIDGQALDPSYFGAYSPYTGVWQPKRYTGTYGTNGFYLPFTNTTSTTTLVADASGLGNNWTPNNISLTAGTTYDSMLDSPTPYYDGGNGRGNYCDLNPLQSYGTGTLTLTNGNLTSNKTATNSDSGWTSTFALSSGKWYAEFTFTGAGVGGNNGGVGIIGVASTTVPGEASNTVRWMDAGTLRKNATSTSYGSALVSGGIAMVAYDADNNQIWFGANGSWFASGNPATNTSPSATGLINPMIPATYHYAATAVTIDANFGQRPFSHTPPSGFKPLNTLNLPAPTIANGANYMAAVTYTGNGGTQTVTISNSNSGNNPLGKYFLPDFIWMKNRTASADHALYDDTRTLMLSSNTTAAEVPGSNVIAYNNDGWLIGTGDSRINASANNYVGWLWNAGTGSSSIPSGGTITPTGASINQTAGFSIIAWAGNSTSGATIPHGLGAAPSIIITKSRSNLTSWVVGIGGISGFGVNDYLSLNSTNGKLTSSTFYQAYGSSTFTVGVSAADEMNKTGNNYISYIWTPIAGFSSFGSYTGNGSADGPFIYTGFRSRWIMIKKTSAADDWVILDTSRNTYNVVTNWLFPNSASAELTTATSPDVLSNGFKLRSTSGATNASGATFIYAAFAENPFKYALAR